MGDFVKLWQSWKTWTASYFLIFFENESWKLLISLDHVDLFLVLTNNFRMEFSILVHCKELDTAKKCLRKLSMPDSIFKMKTPSYSKLSEFPGQNTDTPTHKVAKFWIFWNTQGGLFRKSTSCIHTIWQISAYYFLTYQDSRTVWPKSFEKIPNRFFIHSLQMALCSYLSISYLDKIWREVKFEYSLT